MRPVKNLLTLCAILISLPLQAQTEQWIDRTELIINPNFDTPTHNGWTLTYSGNMNLRMQCMEVWNGNFNIYQDIKGLPNGRYRVGVQAYYRVADHASSYRNYQNNTETHNCRLYAGSAEKSIASVYTHSESSVENAGLWWTPNRGQGPYYSNTMESARVCFDHDAYHNLLEFTVTDGTARIGIINENNEYNSWAIWDNFTLEYWGVVTNISAINFGKTTEDLVVGETRKIDYTIQPDNATYPRLKWESSNSDVATVDDNGCVTALAAGTAVITATATDDGGATAACTVNITRNDATAESMIINEIQASNVDMFVDPSWNYGSWVELYNPTDRAVNIYDYFVSDDPENLKAYRLSPTYGVIPAHGYRVVWFDHYEDDPRQVNFKLSYGGGTIYFSDETGKLIASQTYPPAISRTSYARTADGGDTWGVTAEPTPGRSNSTSAFASEQLAAPAVDKDGQIFTGSLHIAVNIPDGTTLRYTTDGTAPTATNGRTSGNGRFDISATTLYRFRLFQDGMLPSTVVTRSYIRKEHDLTLPVISIVTDKDHLYGDSLGIFVPGVNGKPGNGQSTPCNWNMDWDRPVNFEYLTPEGASLFNQEVNMSAVGGWSRSFEPHSFKLKANKIYDGKNAMEYPFFAEKPYIKNKTLQIRNGGNDNYARIKDAALQQIIATSGLYVNYQSYQPVVHYLNGKFIGLINMREPNNKHFAYANYGYDDELLDQFEMNPDSGYVQKCGTPEAYLRWYDLAKECGQSDEAYDEICSMVDIDEYANYMAVETYLGSTDWPHNNVKGFRSHEEGSKFHFPLFDLDFAFNTSTPFTRLESEQIHTFDFLYDKQMRKTEEVKFTVIFLNMLKNATFRKRFIDAFCLVAGSVFEPARSKEIVDNILARINPMLALTNASATGTANEVKNNLAKRQATLINELKSYSAMGLSGQSGISAKLSANIAEARLSVNDQHVPTDRFDGTLFSPVTLRATAPASYRFIGWKKLSGTTSDGTSDRGEIVCTDAEYTLPATGTHNLCACFEPLTEAELAAGNITPVRINEVSAANSMYVNDRFKKNDWVELYNTTADDIDLNGMYISDDLSKPKKYQISAQESGASTIIPAHGYKLIWCDKLDPKSQLHASFKLDADGGDIILTAADMSWTDTLSYCAHNGTQTVGRYPDASDSVYVMDVPTIETSNIVTSYATGYNKPLRPTAVDNVYIHDNGSLSIRYTGTDIVVRDTESATAYVRIYTPGGLTVLETTADMRSGRASISVSDLPAGTYIAQAVSTDGRQCAMKFAR